MRRSRLSGSSCFPPAVPHQIAQPTLNNSNVSGGNNNSRPNGDGGSGYPVAAPDPATPTSKQSKPLEPQAANAGPPLPSRY